MKGLPVRPAIFLVVVMLFAALVQNDVIKSKAESLEEYVQFRRDMLWRFPVDPEGHIKTCVDDFCEADPAVAERDPAPACSLLVCKDTSWKDAVKRAAWWQACQIALGPSILINSFLYLGVLAYNVVLEVINWVVRVGIY